MHKPPVLMLASNNNSGHLRALGEAFAGADPKINIRSIGGGEANGIGVFTIAIDNDTDDVLAQVAQIVSGLNGVTLVQTEGVTFELENDPGALGKAAGVLEDANPSINILSLLVIGTHGDRAIVLLGVEDEQVASNARDALTNEGYFVYPEEHDHRD